MQPNIIMQWQMIYYNDYYNPFNGSFSCFSNKHWFTWNVHCQGEKDTVIKAKKKTRKHSKDCQVAHHFCYITFCLKQHCAGRRLEEEKYSASFLWTEKTWNWKLGTIQIHTPNDDSCVLPQHSKKPYDTTPDLAWIEGTLALMDKLCPGIKHVAFN